MVSTQLISLEGSLGSAVTTQWRSLYIVLQMERLYTRKRLYFQIKHSLLIAIICINFEYVPEHRDLREQTSGLITCARRTCDKLTITPSTSRRREKK